MPHRLHKKRRAAKKNVKRRAPRHHAKKPSQMAKITEVVEFTDLNPNFVTNLNFNLSQFDRASQIAPSFKWYKAAKVTWYIEPLFNTFQEGSGAAASIPYLYHTMNRTQDTTGQNIADLQAMGASPRKMTSKMKFSYKPNWCAPSLIMNQGNISANLVYTSGLTAAYGWLASFPQTTTSHGQSSIFNPAVVVVNPTPPGYTSTVGSPVVANQTVYNGSSIFADQEYQGSTSVAPIARITCQVEWHFKDAHCTYIPNPSSVTYALPKDVSPPAPAAP